VEILEANDLIKAPVDPLALADLEAPKLRICAGDFRNQCDGQLEYHPDRDLFVLFYNNKYDRNMPKGKHHPRTRFSIAHELGHFYIEHHRFALMQGASTHSSKSEFSAEQDIEREADAFAASLLMPTPLFRPMVNRGELSVDRIREIANHFQASHLSAAIRCVQHSDFPCEVVGIRNGQIAWRFRPEGKRDPLKEGGCYCIPRGSLKSRPAQKQWQAFLSGCCEEKCEAGSPLDWFSLYGAAADKDFTVWEHYLPVPIMDTLVVLLTVSETELFDPTEDYS
jgi:hypothetical protein